jgi:hypothetical protein
MICFYARSRIRKRKAAVNAIIQTLRDLRFHPVFLYKMVFYFKCRVLLCLLMLDASLQHVRWQVVFAQRAIRSFLTCHRARLLVLEKLWRKLEREDIMQHVKRFNCQRHR